MKHERISITPTVMGGKPCIAGTPITVELILEDHPRLTREDILAALAFASDYMAQQAGSCNLDSR